ncbi:MULTISPECIES: DUF6036 family nucleotidyltransferase [Microbacterium]|uniref:DUF6036 family nucleotidyltransferase n=1 Tax=Microbacterium TaxID=33882 RepID=UPI0028ECAEAD|nr:MULTISPECIES: DUF6036 family nucleotidyltransferase [Microbacterium]
MDKIYVIGSQSILGTFGEDELPERATDSVEVDIFPLGVEDAERMSELLFAIGELSDFHANHGFYVDGVGPSTAVLPTGWQDRVVPVPAERLNGVKVVGLCLDPHDLCVSKIIANRTKDHEFVQELVDAGLIDSGTLLDRLADVKPPVDVLVVNGREERQERDINHAWVFAQSLHDRVQRSRDWDVPAPTRGGPRRAGELGATTNRGRFASKDGTPPEMTL